MISIAWSDLGFSIYKDLLDTFDVVLEVKLACEREVLFKSFFFEDSSEAFLLNSSSAYFFTWAGSMCYAAIFIT